MIQSDGYPFFHLLGNENLLRFPESVFNHFWKKSGDPSVSNDSFLLGVIWWIVDPPKRGFIEQVDDWIDVDCRSYYVKRKTVNYRVRCCH